MRYLYADTSIWNCLCDQGARPLGLSAALTSRGVGLALGFNVLYEIAKQVFNGTESGVKRGQELFEYVLEHLALRIPIVKENWALLVEEALDVAGNKPMESCFRNELDHRLTIQEIEKLCRGDLAPEAVRFFESRRSAARTSRTGMKAHLESRPALKALLRDVSEVALPRFLSVTGTGLQGRLLLLGHLGREFPQNSARELAYVAKQLLERSRYRVSHAMTRSDIYLNWRCVHRGSIRSDLPDDTFHVVSAAYCEVFVTTDMDQADIARHAIDGVQAVVCDRQKIGSRSDNDRARPTPECCSQRMKSATALPTPRDRNRPRARAPRLAEHLPQRETGSGRTGPP